MSKTPKTSTSEESQPVEKKEEPTLRSFFFPDREVTIKAATRKEALEIYNSRFPSNA